MKPDVITELPVVVLFPHNRCQCRCVMCDIWRIRQVRQITPDDLRPHLESFRRLRVREVAFSGGEPQLNHDFGELARMLRGENIRLTLLTAGLLLEAHAAEIAELMDEVIVSLDGPPELHDAIRRVPNAFARLRAGVVALRACRPGLRIYARTTVQKANRNALRATVETARSLGLNSISFLAADLTSAAFNRPNGWDEERQGQIAPDAAEVEELAQEMEALVRDHAADIATRFVAESAAKLRKIVAHFRAFHEQASETAPMCNAPWVSAVIEADGSVRPCFFHESFGNIHQAGLETILNGPQARDFRRSLDVETNPICRRCVCSLYLKNNREKAGLPAIRESQSAAD